jgi:hypothetical protein
MSTLTALSAAHATATALATVSTISAAVPRGHLGRRGVHQRDGRGRRVDVEQPGRTGARQRSWRAAHDPEVARDDLQGRGG